MSNPKLFNFPCILLPSLLYSGDEKESVRIGTTPPYHTHHPQLCRSRGQSSRLQHPPSVSLQVQLEGREDSGAP